jgi:hypothetical protein
VVPAVSGAVVAGPPDPVPAAGLRRPAGDEAVADGAVLEGLDVALAVGLAVLVLTPVPLLTPVPVAEADGVSGEVRAAGDVGWPAAAGPFALPECPVSDVTSAYAPPPQARKISTAATTSVPCSRPRPRADGRAATSRCDDGGLDAASPSVGASGPGG